MSGLTQQELKRILSYDQDTGEFSWKEKKGGRSQVVGCSVKGTYWRIGIDYKSYKAHRLAWLYMTGEWPPEEIDHIDGNGFNNAWDNLRLASTLTNKWNMKKPVTNTSGYKGVNYRRKDGKWFATIRIGEKWPKYLGTFSTPLEAHEARCKAVKELHGVYGRIE